MAWIAIHSGDDEQELYWTTRAAELGSVGSMHSVGRMLSHGDKTVDAEKWWLKAADQGNSDSMCSLAFMYKRSDRLAEYRCWIDRAAHAQHPFAMFALGINNENSGYLGAARKWLQLSGKAGYNLAARHLMRIANAQGDTAYVQQISEALSKSDTTT